MIRTETKLRVRYAETDQMGYAYYGNYATYFEVARVEALRDLGLSYKEMEEDGVMLPVLESNIKYIRPAKYDDELTIKSVIAEMPTVKLVFEHEVYNASGELLTKATIRLVFINKETMKPRPAPAHVIKMFEEVWQEE